MRYLLAMVLALGAFGQGIDPREIGNRGLPFEKLQNAIGTAVAHVARLSAADRATLDRANLVLGQAMAARRDQRKVDKKKILAALKEIDLVATRAFSEPDKKLVAEDRKRAEAAAKEPTQVTYIYVGKTGQPI